LAQFLNGSRDVKASIKTFTTLCSWSLFYRVPISKLLVIAGRFIYIAECANLCSPTTCVMTLSTLAN